MRPTWRTIDPRPRRGRRAARRGLGLELSDGAGVPRARRAQMMPFLAKNFGLREHVQQPNNFVVFKAYFE